MAVNAASSSYVNNASSNKGFSGLASGVDTESMVEQLLSGTQTKIDKQNALKQQLEWKQEIYRDLISQINSFQTKFFSFSSDTNLLSESFFNAMNAVTTSSAFKATATSAAATGTSKMEVRRLATKASLTSGATVSGKLTGKVDTDALQKLLDAQKGTSPEDYAIKFRVGDKIVGANLKSVFVDENGKLKSFASSAERDAAVQKTLRDAFDAADLKDIKVTVKDGNLSLVSEGDDRQTISVTGGTGKLALQRLGLTATSSSVNKASSKTNTLSGKVDDTPAMEFTVTLDGLRKTLKIDLRKVLDNDGNIDTDKVQKELEAGLNQAHGVGQVKVTKTDDGEGFELTTSAGRKVEIGGATETLDALGLKNGQSNRISTGSKLGELNLATKLQGGSYRFTINGREFHFDEETTLADMMDTINRSDAGVRMIYRAQDDTFVLESAEYGTGKQMQMTQSEGNLLNVLFGQVPGTDADGTVKTGKSISSFKLTYTVKEKDEDGEETDVTKDADADTTLEQLGIKLYKDGSEIAADTKLSELADKTGGVLTFVDGRLVVKEDSKDALATLLTPPEGADMPADQAKDAADALSEKLFGVTLDDIKLGVDQGAGKATQVDGQNALVSIDGLLTERSSNSFSMNGVNYDLLDISGTYEKVELGSETRKIFYTDANGRVASTNITDLYGGYIENGTLYNKDGVQLGTGAHYYEKVSDFNSHTNQKPLDSLMIGPSGELQKFVGKADTVTVSQNTDQIVDGIKSFIDEYNKLVKTINDLLDEETNYRDYAPLTSAQKAEMSEREIELWEEKAKQGLLHRDSTLQTFLQNMRTALYQKPAGSYALYELGIETGAWETKGQLQFATDGEAKLRQVLENDPSSVIKLFTDPDNGLSAQLNNILNATAKTSSGSPGTLVQMAGIKGMASEKNNTMYDRIKAIDEKIAALKNTYEKEKSRYWNQFNTMEQLISQMNTQSAYLSQMFSY